MSTLPEAARCSWARTPLLIAYHDEEWGVPLHDDRRLFEFLVLEGMQAGLSWETILRKRPAFRRLFGGFDPRRVASFGPARERLLLSDPGIVRNRLKIRSALANAGRFLEVAAEFGSFDAYLWAFVGGRPLVNRWTTAAEVPAATPLAEAVSRDLRRRGFSFVGPVIVYSFLQAVGMVNDHTIDCFRHRQVSLPPPE